MKPATRVIGLMSGTSLDGVDAALVDFAQGRPRICATAYRPYPASLRAALLALHEPGADELHRAALLSQELARCYADSVNALLTQTHLPPAQIRAIGCHGQTVRHMPQHGYTLQLNQPALLAELTGITVIDDFRSRDLAAGGQGAPLVPAFHAAQFASEHQHRIILNIGGIANLTHLQSGAPVSGFDCGPGNMLLDAWVQRHQQQPYDAGGLWGSHGTCLPELLGRLLTHPYFAAPPPKSCGREQFNLTWLESQLVGTEAPVDVQATLVELTAQAACLAIQREYGTADELYVCGGGAHNTLLLARLAAGLPQTRVLTTEALGLPADWVEAVAFAWLAWRLLEHQPGNLPEVTGARGLRLLGAIHPA
ncbi:MAG: anhydro-N-acetylmuramic acid kinase [Sterolibacterium sp.]|jgi:anhydro-N-acetylmuramic acid kinase|nr:anhydro-N-acetylmuramic acid kinase [Sterolibacterium sp.]